MQRAKYSETRMVWFAITPLINQPIFTFPMVGYISAYQAIIIFFVGLPAMFITMHVTGELSHGILPFLGIVGFTMLRPPLISYEGRLLARLKFMMLGGSSGGRSAKKKPKKDRGKYLGVPSTEKGEPKEPAPAPVRTAAEEPMTVRVGGGERMMQIEITLRKPDGGLFAGRKVIILLDDSPILTSVSSPSGQVRIYLERDECHGSRKLSVSDTAPDGSAGRTLLTKEIRFVGQ